MQINKGAIGKWSNKQTILEEASNIVSFLFSKPATLV